MSPGSAAQPTTPSPFARSSEMGPPAAKAQVRRGSPDAATGRAHRRRCARQLRGGRDDRSRGMQSSRRRRGAQNRAVRLARIEQAPALPSAEEQGSRSDHSRRWAPPAGPVAQVANLKTGTRRSPRPAFLSAQEAGWRIRPSVARGCPLDLHAQRNGRSPQHVPAWRVWRGNLPGLRAKGPAVGAGCGLVRGRKSNHARRKTCSAKPSWAWLRW